MKFFVLLTVLFNVAINSSAAFTMFSLAADSIKAPSKAESGIEKKNRVKQKELVRSRSYSNDAASLEEGYTPLEDGGSIIKTYVLKGNVNLISVSIGSSNNVMANKREMSLRYYLQKGDGESQYREVFFASKPGIISDAAKFAGGFSPQNQGLQSTKKFRESKVSISKAILLETMGDKAEAAAMISKLKKVTYGGLKSIVKLYNKKQPE